jgi:mono/diheme cytochrome c family protein
MNRKHLFFSFLSLVFVLIIACNSNSGNEAGSNNMGDTAATDNTASTDAAAEGSNPKGIGKYQNVELTHPLDEQMVAAGKNIYDVKCSSCHKLTEEKLVGPGYKGVTDRRTPEWIMNFVTNTEEMIAKDTAAQNMLEVCLVKMPNQSLDEADARSVLEFMRKNDGKQ